MRKVCGALMCVASLWGSAHAGSLEEQAKHDPALAAAIDYAKKTGRYHAPAIQVDPREAQAMADRQNNLMVLRLRQRGMNPDTVKKGMWALIHKPSSACASYMRQLTADTEGGAEAFAETDANIMSALETSGSCEKGNLQ